MSSVGDNNSQTRVLEFCEYAEARGETLRSLKTKYGLEPVPDVCFMSIDGKRVLLKTKDVKRILKTWDSATGNIYAQQAQRK